MIKEWGGGILPGGVMNKPRSCLEIKLTVESVYSGPVTEKFPLEMKPFAFEKYISNLNSQ